jgi:prepilin-type N-terminal cleavage/methylation domain-containing protein
MTGGKQKPRGYTVIEVMIVLAISGAMFVMAANFINGRQARTSFTAGVNETASRLQGIIEQVRNGQYTDIDIDCRLNGSTLAIAPAGSSQQGQNQDCIFIGKTFHVSEAIPGEDPSSRFEVFSLAGRREYEPGRLITDLTDIIPTPIHSTSTSANLTTHDVIPQSLRITGPMRTILANGNPGESTYAISILQGFGNQDSEARLQNGPQSNKLYSNNIAAAAQTSDQAAAQILSVPFEELRSAELCLTDGTRFAKITIGDENNQLNVRTEIKGSSCI